MRVLVTGATGAVGRRLVARLLARKDSVVALSRNAEKARALLGNVEVLEADPAVEGAWQDRLKDVDGVVNLAGEKVLQRWSEDARRRIRDSRVRTTENVARAIARAGGKAVLVSASAEAYFARKGDDVLDEDSPRGEGFLSEVCQAWEAACAPAREAGARVANARIGIVMDPEEGALAQMLPPFKMFVGGRAGSGKQWWSWVHRDDMARLLLFALDEPKISGAFNAVAPEPVTAGEFAKILGKVLGRPAWAPIPAFALKLRFGGSAEIILDGVRLKPRRLLEAGFTFEHPTLEEALRSLL